MSTHTEIVATEYRAYTAVVTDMGRLARNLRNLVDVSSTSSALAAVDRRMANVMRRPDEVTWGTFSDVMMAGDQLGRWHSTRDVLGTHEFVEPSDPSSWAGSSLVDTAHEFLLDKGLMTPRAFAALKDGYRSAGFTIAGVTEFDMLHVARRSLARSLRQGYTLERATQAMQDALARAGYSQLRPWHAQLVAQMNFASAYGAGQWELLHDPKLAGIIPAYRYMTMEDQRVRPEHEAMHGFVASRRHPIWNRWWPPNGYNCRCWIVGVSVRAWRARGSKSDKWPMVEVIDSDGVVVEERRAQPDKASNGVSFAGNPSRYLRARAREGRR